ncbi:heterokaryon incompatibility protein [Colletotrichum tofieldiae]|nr:heterokaryon incompatibility protein [Colletotrichum tofieldiae]GKT68709.1 heterokaryon incompatibility protein [Colletotrichum tofieldiae]
MFLAVIHEEWKLFWGCATLSASGSLPSGFPAPLDEAASTDRHWREGLQGAALSVRPLAGTPDDSLETFLESAVRAYTRCSLSFHKDKLQALWGIAKPARDALGEEYAKGLWSNSLYEQLAWRTADYTTSRRAAEGEGSFPSWSRASLKGTIEVAPRVPAVPRFYSARAHGGMEVKFQIRKPLFGRYEGEHSTVWREDMVNMTCKLEEASSRVYKKIKTNVVTTITPIPGEALATMDQAPTGTGDPLAAEEKKAVLLISPPNSYKLQVPSKDTSARAKFKRGPDKGSGNSP